MLSLKERLLQAEDDFISSLSTGDGAVSSFADRWELLLQDVDSAMESSCLDSETATLVHTTALRIATYVDASTEIYESYNTLTSELVEQVDHLMSELTLIDKPSTSVPVVSSQPSSPLCSPPPLCMRSLSRTESAPASRRKRRRTSSPPPKAPKRQCSSVKPHPSKMDSIHSLSSRVLALQTPTETRAPRKRRLSDTDVAVPVRSGKRPYLGPRLHAVSDSYLSVYCRKPRKADRIENAQHTDRNGSGDGEAPILSAPLDVLPIPITTFCTDHLLPAKLSGEVELSSMLFGSSFFGETPSSGDGVDAWLTSLLDSNSLTSGLQASLSPLRDSISLSWPNCDPSKIEPTNALHMPFAGTDLEGAGNAINLDDALPWPQFASPSEDIVDWSTVFEYPQPSNSNLQPHLLRPHSPGDSSSESSTDTEDDSPATPMVSSMLPMPLDFLLAPMEGSSTQIKSHDVEIADSLSTFHSQSSFTLC